MVLKISRWTLLTLLCSLVLTACSIPEPPQQSVGTNITNQQVQAHQTRLQRINRWQLSGRFALTEIKSNSKDSAYLSWRSSPQQQDIVITHPLRGELAHLNISAQVATIKVDGEQVQSRSARDLLYHWLLGRLDPRFTQFHFDKQGRLINAHYKTSAGDHWQLTWFYQPQQLLPEQIHAETDQLKLKIQAQSWQTQPSLNTLVL